MLPLQFEFGFLKYLPVLIKFLLDDIIHASDFLSKKEMLTYINQVFNRKIIYANFANLTKKYEDKKKTKKRSNETEKIEVSPAATTTGDKRAETDQQIVSENNTLIDPFEILDK